MEKMNLKVSITITDQDLSDILTTALEGGINYWARGVEVVDRNYRGVASEVLEYGGALFIIGDEDARGYFKKDGLIDKNILINAITKFLKTSPTFIYHSEGEWLLDVGNIDASAADVIIQLAVFGEVIYS